jgi:hypothetical protein
MAAVADCLQANIPWKVIIAFAIKTGILAIITAIIASAWRLATTLRIQTFPFFIHHSSLLFSFLATGNADSVTP